jgi:RimJ/RimL family protein N-acetyltransferase
VVTNSLIIETLTTDNMSAAYLTWLQDPNVTQYLETRHTQHTRESVAQYVESMLTSDNDLMMGIFLKSKKKHIGNIKMGGLDRLYGRADIGIMIGERNFWGKGYASEAINGLCDLAFNTIGVRRLWAGAYASNKGSTKAFLKAGFRQEGILRGNCILNGQPEDAILVGKLSEDHKVSSGEQR